MFLAVILLQLSAVLADSWSLHHRSVPSRFASSRNQVTLVTDGLVPPPPPRPRPRVDVLETRRDVAETRAAAAESRVEAAESRAAKVASQDVGDDDYDWERFLRPPYLPDSLRPENPRLLYNSIIREPKKSEIFDETPWNPMGDKNKKKSVGSVSDSVRVKKKTKESDVPAESVKSPLSKPKQQPVQKPSPLPNIDTLNSPLRGGARKNPRSKPAFTKPVFKLSPRRNPPKKKFFPPRSKVKKYPVSKALSRPVKGKKPFFKPPRPKGRPTKNIVKSAFQRASARPPRVLSRQAVHPKRPLVKPPPRNLKKQITKLSKPVVLKSRPTSRLQRLPTAVSQARSLWRPPRPLISKPRVSSRRRRQNLEVDDLAKAFGLSTIVVGSILAV